MIGQGHTGAVGCQDIMKSIEVALQESGMCTCSQERVVCAMSMLCNDTTKGRCQ